VRVAGSEYRTADLEASLDAGASTTCPVVRGARRQQADHTSARSGPGRPAGGGVAPKRRSRRVSLGTRFDPEQHPALHHTA
jgi:hypothetical protein